MSGTHRAEERSAIGKRRQETALRRRDARSDHSRPKVTREIKREPKISRRIFASSPDRENQKEMRQKIREKVSKKNAEEGMIRLGAEPRGV